MLIGTEVRPCRNILWDKKRDQDERRQCKSFKLSYLTDYCGGEGGIRT